MEQGKIKSSILLLLTAFIWGAAFVAQSVGMNYVEPFTFNGVRSFVGGIVLVPCIWFLNKRLPEPKRKKQNKKMLILGGILCGVALFIASSLQQIGIADTTVGKAGFITSLYIILVPILGILIGKKVRASIWISVLLAVIGFYLLCMAHGFSIHKADGMVLLGAVGFSVHILIIDYFSEKADGVKMACIQFFVCGFLSLIPMLLWEKVNIREICLAWMPILYAGVLSCGVGYTFQIIGQKNLNPTIAALILSLESVFSALAGWVLLGQALHSREILGCILVFTAIILAQLPERKTKKKEK